MGKNALCSARSVTGFLLNSVIINLQNKSEIVNTKQQYRFDGAYSIVVLSNKKGIKLE